MPELTQTFLVVAATEAERAALGAMVPRRDEERLGCADGAEALRLVTSRPVALMVLSARCHGMDGLQVLRMVRGLDDRRYVAVVFVSKDRAQRLAALRLGADDAIDERFDPDEFAARVERALASRQRLEALAAQAADLQHLAITDGLTQLYNHRHFQERLREEFRRAQRYDDPLALVLLDLDHFKHVNDSHGHLVGDEVLREAAAVLRRCVRDTDLLARYGGEEFCALLPKTHFAGSLTVAERIWKELAGAQVGPGLRVTASIGVSGYPARGVNSPEQLMRTADEALYRAKGEGRNKICLYSQVGVGEGGAAAKVG